MNGALLSSKNMGWCTPADFFGELDQEFHFNLDPAVIPKAKERSRLILETLCSRSMTVSEITDELVKAGRIPYYNRNYVAPRLSELKDMGVVETCGRRRSTHSTATEAVWRRKEVEHDSP